jgi:hypothetical protein
MAELTNFFSEDDIKELQKYIKKENKTKEMTEERNNNNIKINKEILKESFEYVFSKFYNVAQEKFDILNNDFENFKYLCEKMDAEKIKQLILNKINCLIDNCYALKNILPKTIQDFEYKDCIIFELNDRFQPIAKVVCKCHKKISQQQKLFNELNEYFNKIIKKHELIDYAAKKMEKYNGSYDNEIIKNLCVNWSSILEQVYKSKIKTHKSSYGKKIVFDDDIEKMPYISFDQ